jgi:hypothetical protein
MEPRNPEVGANASFTEPAVDDSMVSSRMPQSDKARIPLVASPDAPDALP